jgi:hypothetical protein
VTQRGVGLKMCMNGRADAGTDAAASDGAAPYTRAVREMPSVADAEELAKDLLTPLLDRWAHVQAVAARADGLTPAIDHENDRQLLVVAAWLHDIGYSPTLRDTGCHQIDGADL